MNVFVLDADANKYQNLVLEHGQDADQLIDWFKGQPIGSSWRSLAVKVLRDQSHRDRPPSDFPSFGGVVPVFSQHAVEALYDLLQRNGEILPLICQEGVYFAFNVTRLVDALDMNASEFKYFKSTGRIMRIVRHEFDAEKLGAESIFKIPQVPEGYVFVTDEFVRRVQEAGLVGFDFRRVWSGPDA
jgi:hypothetical protein